MTVQQQSRRCRRCCPYQKRQCPVGRDKKPWLDACGDGTASNEIAGDNLQFAYGSGVIGRSDQTDKADLLSASGIKEQLKSSNALIGCCIGSLDKHIGFIGAAGAIDQFNTAGAEIRPPMLDL